MRRPGNIETSIGTATVLHRLAVGVECRDAIGDVAVLAPVRCGRQTHLRELPRVKTPGWPCLDLDRADRGRFVLRHDRPLPKQLVLRIDDPFRIYLPRRFEVTPWLTATLDETTAGNGYVPVGSRLLRSWLWPGSAYRSQRGSTIVRGRVVDEVGTGVRWARLAATGADGGPAGHTHTDEHGEFVLVVTTIVQRPIESNVPIEIAVMAPAAPGPVDPSDRCADLTIEPVPQSSVPPTPDDLDNSVLRGTAMPAGYVGNTNQPLSFDAVVGAESSIPADIVFVPQM